MKPYSFICFTFWFLGSTPHLFLGASRASRLRSPTALPLPIPPPRVLPPCVLIVSHDEHANLAHFSTDFFNF